MQTMHSSSSPTVLNFRSHCQSSPPTAQRLPEPMAARPQSRWNRQIGAPERFEPLHGGHQSVQSMHLLRLGRTFIRRSQTSFNPCCRVDRGVTTPRLAPSPDTPPVSSAGGRPHGLANLARLQRSGSEPRSSFSDPELRAGTVAVNALGLPLPRSGNFADVYEFTCPGNARWAVKCFTRQVAGLRERYAEVSRHLHEARLPFAVDFQYLDQGVRVRGQWYPLLKMRWVEGLLLNEFVRDSLDKPALLQSLGLIWQRMARRLREAGVAHADLQHGNVLLVPGQTASSLAVKLIDYDGLFVPALAGRKSGEVGHPNYQHPQRLREGTYNAEVDRLPLLAVATSLRARGRRPRTVGPPRQRRQPVVPGVRPARPFGVGAVPRAAEHGRPGGADADGAAGGGVRTDTGRRAAAGRVASRRKAGQGDTGGRRGRGGANGRRGSGAGARLELRRRSGAGWRATGTACAGWRERQGQGAGVGLGRRRRGGAASADRRPRPGHAKG